MLLLHTLFSLKKKKKKKTSAVLNLVQYCKKEPPLHACKNSLELNASHSTPTELQDLLWLNRSMFNPTDYRIGTGVSLTITCRVWSSETKALCLLDQYYRWKTYPILHLHLRICGLVCTHCIASLELCWRFDSRCRISHDNIMRTLL